jgi:rhodanese-related sulfurtransferase
MSNPFAARLAHETDPADVWAAVRAGRAAFTLVDARSRESFDRAHLPGAVSIHDELAAGPRVTYSWSPACNGATKAAARLFDEGRDVREMIGGFEYWVREGLPIEGAVPTSGGNGDTGARTSGGDRLVGP